MVPWASSNGGNYDNAVPRNSSLISTAILATAWVWFQGSNTYQYTIFLNVLIGLFLFPLVLKFTISSNMKKNVILPPSGLQYHGESSAENGQGKFQTFEFIKLSMIKIFIF